MFWEIMQYLVSCKELDEKRSNMQNWQKKTLFLKIEGEIMLKPWDQL